ncbi:hypothetical protein GCM10023238_37930 [Streptomyces heliomycini]
MGMNLLAAVWLCLPPCSYVPYPRALGPLEVNRRGTLDFGGGAAGDHRLPADQEVGSEGRARRVCMLLGFYLASSTIAPTISELTTNLAGMIGSINF